MLRNQQKLLDQVAVKVDMETKIDWEVDDMKYKLDTELTQLKTWITDQFNEKLGGQGNLNQRLSQKAEASDIIRLRRSISEINLALEKGFDSIILSAKSEVRIAVDNSATQDDFTYLKETKADKDEIQSLLNRVHEVETNFKEFKANENLSFSDDEGEDSQEEMDDVMDINSPAAVEMDEMEDDLEGSFKRDKSWKTDAAILRKP